MSRPVLTIFAGPNGSGKSSLKREFDTAGRSLGTYINADEIASALAMADSSAPREAIERAAFHEASRRREECLQRGLSFSFETVFSHESKVEFIRRASERGFHVALYFVSTENSRLNVERVAKRVREGGHDVPVEKILARYRRAMANIVPATMLADETVLFDNSSSSMRLVASVVWGNDHRPQVTLDKLLPTWVVQWGQEIAPLVKSQIDRRIRHTQR